MGREARAKEAQRAKVADMEMAENVGGQWAELALQAIQSNASQPIVEAVNQWMQWRVQSLLAAYPYVKNRAAWLAIQEPNTWSIQLTREVSIAGSFVLDALNDAKKDGHATGLAVAEDGARKVLSNLYGQVTDAFDVYMAGRKYKQTVATAKKDEVAP